MFIKNPKFVIGTSPANGEDLVFYSTDPTRPNDKLIRNASVQATWALGENDGVGYLKWKVQGANGLGQYIKATIKLDGDDFKVLSIEESNFKK